METSGFASMRTSTVGCKFFPPISRCGGQPELLLLLLPPELKERKAVQGNGPFRPRWLQVEVWLIIFGLASGFELLPPSNPLRQW